MPFVLCAAQNILRPVLAYVPLLAGHIENWRLGCYKFDDLMAIPYYTKSPHCPKLNKLFSALYNLIFSKLANIGYLVHTSSQP